MSLEQYNLNCNPFRMTPATNPEDLIWAGFPIIKARFESRIKRSIKLSNGSLILNWGEYGSGKTHAARYFSKTSVLQNLADELGYSIPYPLVMPLPKSKEPVYSIFINVIDKLDIEEIRLKHDNIELDINLVIDNITDNMHIKSVLKGIFNNDLEEIDLLKKYFYGNLSTSELKGLNKFGILRNLNSDSDYTKILAGLFTCLTFNKEMYSTVIIWIDEFEDLATLNNSVIDKINNFLREIMDNTPNNLLLFLNLTQSALFDFEDLGEYVAGSVRSRIKDRNDFVSPSKEELINYVKELISKYRITPEDDEFNPFSDVVLNKILDDLGNVALRTVNEALSLLIEIGDLEEEPTISLEFYEKNKSEIIGWKQ